MKSRVPLESPLNAIVTSLIEEKDKIQRHKRGGAILWRIFVATLALVLGIGPKPSSAQPVSIKLFDATSSFGTGPERTRAEATQVASRSLVITMAPGDTAIISSTPDGTGPVVIDNFMAINGRNICREALGQGIKGSCFGQLLSLQTGVPIEAVRAPIPAIDVSGFIPLGTSSVLFDLRDFGVVAGNTDLFLVTNASVNLPTRLVPSPRAIRQTFDEAVAVCRDSITSSVRARFNEAFTQQITKPVMKSRESSGEYQQTISDMADRLAAASQDLTDGVTETIDVALRNITAPPMLRSSPDVLGMTGALVSVAELSSNVIGPSIRTRQSIGQILAQGIDPTQLEVSPSNITATCNFTMGGGPQPIFATITPAISVQPAPPNGTKVTVGASVMQRASRSK